MTKLPAFDDLWCQSAGDPTKYIVPNMNSFAPPAIYTVEAHVTELVRTLTGDNSLATSSQFDAGAPDSVLFLGNYNISLNGYNLLYKQKLRCNGWDTLYSRWSGLVFLAEGRSVDIGPAVYKKSRTEIEARLKPPAAVYMSHMNTNGPAGFYDNYVNRILLNVHIGSGETILREYIRTLYAGSAPESLGAILSDGFADLFARWTARMFTGTYGAYNGFQSCDPHVTIANELRKAIGDRRFVDTYFKPNHTGSTGEKLGEITRARGIELDGAYTQGKSENLFGTTDQVRALADELIAALPE